MSKIDLIPADYRAAFNELKGMGKKLRTIIGVDDVGTGSLRGLRSRYEQCALFMHAGFAIRNRSLPDIWPVFLPHRKPTGHKSEKPVELIERIITESGSGDLILDPFLGSGTTAVAAKRLGKRCIGIEIEERWCEVAARRVDREGRN